MAVVKKGEEIAIRVQGVGKAFRLPHERQSTIKNAFINVFKGKRTYETQQALKDISFDVKKGEFFGIVGRNGSGKSTLLKLISGIYTPDSGSIEVNGKLVPFIELGVGFNYELSGRDNVFLNGALLGFTREEMEAMYDEIVEFAELEKFMDQKLKNYSSGMQVRLAFSIAIRANADILVLDEVLAVGDEAFQRKCFNYFDTLKKDKKTVILVTHSMSSVRDYCDRAILIKDGTVSTTGNPDKIASAYSSMFIKEQIEQQKLEEIKHNKIYEQTKLHISDVILNNISTIQANNITSVLNFKEDFILSIDISTKKQHNDLTMGVHFIDQAGRIIMVISTKMFGKFSLKKGTNSISFYIQNILSNGRYYINLAIEENASKQLLIQEQEVFDFTIVGKELTEYPSAGMVYPDIKVNDINMV